MGNKYKEEDVLYVADTVFIEGSAAFMRGENVRIERVEPNMEMPEYKYVVYSSKLRNYYFLRDQDLSRKYPLAGGSPRRFSLDIFHSRTAWILTGSLMLILVIAAVVLGYFVFFASPGPEAAAKKYYEAICEKDSEGLLSVVDLPEDVKSNPECKSKVVFFIESANNAGHVTKELTYDVDEKGESAIVTATSSDGAKSTLELMKKDGQWYITNSLGVQYINSSMYSITVKQIMESLDTLVGRLNESLVDLEPELTEFSNMSLSQMNNSMKSTASASIPILEGVTVELAELRKQTDSVVPPEIPWCNNSLTHANLYMSIDTFGVSLGTYCNAMNIMQSSIDASYPQIDASVAQLTTAEDYANQVRDGLKQIEDAHAAQHQTTF